MPEAIAEAEKKGPFPDTRLGPGWGEWVSSCGKRSSRMGGLGWPGSLAGRQDSIRSGDVEGGMFLADPVSGVGVCAVDGG